MSYIIYAKKNKVYMKNFIPVLRYEILDYINDYVFNELNIVFLTNQSDNGDVVIQCSSTDDADTLFNIINKFLKYN